MYIIKRILNIDSSWLKFRKLIFKMGLDKKDFLVLLFALIVLIIADVCKYKGLDLNKWICKQGIWFRWIIYFGGIFAILLFGAYGVDFDAGQFIYFNFRRFYIEEKYEVVYFYRSFSSMMLWGQEGITSYSLATPQQSMPCSYFLLEEALKRQKPKIFY